MLPDYGGPLFDLKKNKLVQPDIRDINNELIAPWNLYNELRPGTVVLVVATLVTWVMPEVEGNVESPLKKVCFGIFFAGWRSDKGALVSSTTFVVTACVFSPSLVKRPRNERFLDLAQ